MSVYPLYVVDAFTTERLTGNPAGVVLEADGLSDRQMQAIARELNHSETVFLLSPDAPDHEVRLRYFTPRQEVPICGHATIAAHYVRALLRRDDSRRLWHKTGIGVLPVDIERLPDRYRVVMTQGEPAFGAVLAGAERRALVTALAIDDHDLSPDLPVQIVSTGHSKVMVPLRYRDVLERLAPDSAALTALSRVIGCNGYYAFTLDSDDPAIRVHGRMFAPALGIVEDPVTGNANGPLGAYLAARQALPLTGGGLTFTAQQGTAMGRRGVVRVTVLVAGERPATVTVAGDAVIVYHALLEL
jgi:PhzF family phenazine biosynthesis protein